jgi:hypothetical protein
MSQSVAFFMLSIDNLHLSSLDRSFFSPVSQVYINYEILSSISNSKFSCKSVTHRFPHSTFIFRSVSHRNQIFQYGTFFPIVVSSTCNWSSLWTYNTAISKTLFSLQFPHSSAKQTVSFHALYIFKTMHTNSPSHFHLFKDTKQKEISLFTYAPFQHTKFSKCNLNIKCL